MCREAACYNRLDRHERNILTLAAMAFGLAAGKTGSDNYRDRFFFPFLNLFPNMIDCLCRGSRISLAALVCALIAGCNPPPRPSLPEISSAAKFDDVREDLATMKAAEDSHQAIVLSRSRLPWETWHTYFIGNRPVGFIHILSENDGEMGTDHIRTSITDHLVVRRGPSTLVQTLQQVIIESRTKGLISFTSDLRVGPVQTLFEGQVSGDTLTTSMTRGKEKQTESVPWKQTYGGLAAIQQSFLLDPIKIGESRRLKLLTPVQYRMGVVEMKCQHQASIATMEETFQNANEVNIVTLMDDGKSIESVAWIDKQGNMLKSYTPSLDLSAIRSNKTLAEAAIQDPVDVFSVLAVDVIGNLTDPAKAFRVGYLLKPKTPISTTQDDPQKNALTPQPGQWFRRQDTGTVQLLVSRDPTEPNRDGFETLIDEPTDADLANNAIIDSNAAEVRKLAALTKATEPRIVATDLTRTVNQLIRPGDFTRGFATASQTAKDGVGDCTERAVLLAAMLRARQIPTRVAAGWVYHEADGKPKMAYHMWTLAWIDQQWLPLDATIGDVAPADRIALTSSNLADGNEYDTLAPILASVGKWSIEILNAKYQEIK